MIRSHVTGMKALSIRQPWAWLICAGYKDIENRDWPTRFQGRVYVHASTSTTELNYNVAQFIRERTKVYWGDKVEYGRIIGEVDITGCVEKSDSPWFVGKYGFTLANPVLYDKPIPCKGRLGFFEPVFPEGRAPHIDVKEGGH